MKRKLFFALDVIAMALLLGSTTLAAPAPKTFPQAVQANAHAAIKTTFNINVVFVGYDTDDVDISRFEAELPTTYNPQVIAPLYYGIEFPVGIEGDYAFNYTFAPTSFADTLFEHLASIGTKDSLTNFQKDYNNQVNKSLTITGKVLYIDAPSTEKWLMTHARRDLGIDVSTYTIFFINWHGRSDFQFHVYTKTDSPDPDTGYNFGIERASRKMIAWGGSHGRTWFYDLSAGPEFWSDNWNVDDADLNSDGITDYRMPPVWEYGNVSGYRPFDDLSGDLGKIARWVAIDLLFTTSPFYDPLASAPHSGRGKRIFINMLEDAAKSSHGSTWIDKAYILKTMQQFQPYYKWSVTLKERRIGKAKQPFRIWVGLVSMSDCWDVYEDILAELFCFFDNNRDDYLPITQKDYIGGVFAFNTTDKNLNDMGWLWFADDNWLDGTPSYVFTFSTPQFRDLGYGFSTTTTSAFGLHIGGSFSTSGYDSDTKTDFGPDGDLYFVWSGDESHTVMSGIKLSNDFGRFDHDNMERFLAARALSRASEIAAQVRQINNGRETRELLEDADTELNRARESFRAMEYEHAAQQALAGLERVRNAAQLANLNVPIVEPLSRGGPRKGPKYVNPIRFPKN
ncbi:MAG: uncharacterized protein HW390_2565 [Candidatus Brocadiaceae bacterium]|nr:uncharacterized protein [Candidatus Brocadiaceae bacterium]